MAYQVSTESCLLPAHQAPTLAVHNTLRTTVLLLLLLLISFVVMGIRCGYSPSLKPTSSASMWPGQRARLWWPYTTGSVSLMVLMMTVCQLTVCMEGCAFRAWCREVQWGAPATWGRGAGLQAL